MADIHFKRDMDGFYICPYNDGCRCTSTNCDPCGWNPAVYRQRIMTIAQRLGVPEDELAKILNNKETR